MISDSEIWDIRDRLVKASLTHIPFDGWTMAALRRGGKDAGLSEGDVARAFPTGALDAIEHHSRLADTKMLETLAAMDVMALRVPARITTAVRIRLEQNAPHREAVRRALATLALPFNVPTGTRCLYRTMDAIWHAAGDTATDWNFYSKRALLAGVYSTTLLYWLDDRSEGLQESWAFLDRRMEDIARIPKLTGGLRQLAERIPGPRQFFRT
ncbi:MAG: COQ9 family protein [Proteobacteria bacterium]|nr:COQ9 family protein [Pseudomonadota bacterium]